MDRWTDILLRLRRLRGDDRGVALISAIGILAVLSALGVSAIAYSSSSYRAAAYSSRNGVAGHVADGGFAYAVSVLAQAPDANVPSALPPGTATIDGAAVSWSAVLTGDVWTITAVSTLPNPTGAAPVQRTVTGRVRVLIDPGSSGNEAWNYVFADDANGCTTIPNNVIITTPLFVRGGLCLANNVAIFGSPLVKVGKDLRIDSPQAYAGKLGTYGNPPKDARIQELQVGGDCYYRTDPADADCIGVPNVYATTTGDQPGNIVKPPVDLEKWYAEARPGPLHPCTSGSFPGGFDNNATTLKDLSGHYVSRDRSLLLPVNLMPEGVSYDCVVMEGPHTLGRIAWNHVTRELTVMGTIYFDGDIVMANNLTGVYSGRAVIYASGRIELAGSTTLCGYAGCDNNLWDPNENLIVFVAGTSTDADGFFIHNSAKFQGAVYAVNDVREDNLAVLTGPAIARQLYLLNHAESAKWVPIWALVNGTPTSGSSTRLEQLGGTWAG